MKAEQNLNEVCKASRELYWDELPIEQKIERVKEGILVIKYICEETRRVVIDLKDHSHLEGKILIPIKRYGEEARQYKRSLFNERPR